MDDERTRPGSAWLGRLLLLCWLLTLTVPGWLGGYGAGRERDEDWPDEFPARAWDPLLILASIALAILLTAVFVRAWQAVTRREPESLWGWRVAVGGSVVLALAFAAERYGEGPGEPLAVITFPFLYAVFGPPFTFLVQGGLTVGRRWARWNSR